MDDKDDLARIIFTATPRAYNQTWEQTSEGWRNRCRDKADDAMAAGWRKVGAEDVVVSRDDMDRLVRLYDYVNDISGGMYEGGYRKQAERLKAALADPAGANGGE